MVVVSVSEHVYNGSRAARRASAMLALARSYAMPMAYPCLVQAVAAGWEAPLARARPSWRAEITPGAPPPAGAGGRELAASASPALLRRMLVAGAGALQ